MKKEFKIALRHSFIFVMDTTPPDYLVWGIGAASLRKDNWKLFLLGHAIYKVRINAGRHLFNYKGVK